MPKYTFQHPEGGLIFKRLSFEDYEAIQAGTKEVVTDDGTVLQLVFNPGQVGFTLKDGVSGGWASKALKENKYRQARSVEMARREKDHVFKTRLVPNYQGHEGHNWKDIQAHVRDVDGIHAARTYDRLVAQEEKGTS